MTVHNIEGALVLGCGYTGMVLLRKIELTPLPVWATSRDAKRLGILAQAGATPVQWEAPNELPKTRANTAFVLFAPGDLDPVEVANLFPTGMRTVYCSSTSVYGEHDGAWVDEDTPCDPGSERGRRRVAFENAFRDRGGVVVRPGGIYGPKRNIVERHRGGRLRLPSDADLDRPVNLIHVDDLASILWAAAQRGRPGAVYTAVDGSPVLWSALASVAEEVAGKPIPEAVPGSSPISAFLRESRRCRADRIHDELGVDLQHPNAIETLRALG
jgi:hypothetical protein